MRVNKPQPFDPKKEYKPKERAVYRGMVIMAKIWTATDKRLANTDPQIFMQRCVRCKINRDDCPAIGLQCDKYHRKDKKNNLLGICMFYSGI